MLRRVWPLTARLMAVYCVVYCVDFIFGGSFVQQYVSTRPQTVVQPSLVNLSGQVAQTGSVYTVQQQVNRQARPSAVKLMHASVSEEVHCDTST